MKISDPKLIKDFQLPESVSKIVIKRARDLFYYACYREESTDVGIASVYLQGFSDGKDAEEAKQRGLEDFEQGSGI